MQKLLALVLLSFSLFATAATTINTFQVNLGGSPAQYAYDVQIVQTTGIAEVAIPYANLVPVGETRPIRIYDSMIRSYGKNTDNSGMHFITVESPAGGGNWKTPVNWQTDLQGNISFHGFTNGLYMSPGDELCIDTQGTVLTGFSAGVNYTIGQ